MKNKKVKKKNNNNKTTKTETKYAYNGAKCILAFLTGSQSLSQLDGNCQVFARQLPSKLIRESWLTSPLSNHCAPLFSLSLVKI